MNNKKYIFRSLLSMAAAVSLVACDNDELLLGSADTDVLTGADGNVVYITDGKGASEISYVDFSDEYTLKLYARTTKAIEGTCTVQFTYDMSVLSAFNAGQESELPAFPQAQVTLANNGSISLAAGKTESDALDVQLFGSDNLDPQQTYAIPFKVTVTNGKLANNEHSYMVLVRDCTRFPGSDKTYQGKPGMKVIACVEINNHNPLNVMPFTLKDSKKQLVDMVVLFSANINYNSTTGKVYISRNQQTQAILDNRAKYLKPLQERGIKVILSILGNHDASGISTLTPEASKAFAQEVKNVCDAYELDGVMLDDEYTDYDGAASGQVPLFQARSVEACSRMAYDIKKANPDCLVLSYAWGSLYYGAEINGEPCSNYFDYVMENYRYHENPVNTYPGLRQDQACTGSWALDDGNNYNLWIPSSPWASSGPHWDYDAEFSLTGMREEGYGGLLIYDWKLTPSWWVLPWFQQSLNIMSNAFYGEDVVYDGSYFPKDY